MMYDNEYDNEPTLFYTHDNFLIIQIEQSAVF